MNFLFDHLIAVVVLFIDVCTVVTLWIYGSIANCFVSWHEGNPSGPDRDGEDAEGPGRASPSGQLGEWSSEHGHHAAASTRG